MATTKKVLIVVDVQNCFINGGSLGDAQTDSIEQIKEILKLMKENDHIYLTRDYHPNNHMSLRNTDESRYVNFTNVFPNHCRNRNANCPKRDDIIKKINKDDNKSKANNEVPGPWTDNAMVSIEESKKYTYNGKEHPIIGTDLSYLYFASTINEYKEYQEAIDQLISDPNKQYTIGLIKGNNTKPEPSLESINYKISGIDVGTTGKKMYELTKGEYCDYESYSAFNYHLKFDYDASNNDVVSKPLPFDTKYSTGLWENIIEKVIDKDTNSELTITVCGLVGNICVMNTVHNGIVTWDKLYSKQYPKVKINFVYSFSGTRFLPGAAFNLKKTNYQEKNEINELIVSHFIDDFEILDKSNQLNSYTENFINNIKLTYRVNNEFYKIENKQLKILDKINLNSQKSLKDQVLKSEKKVSSSLTAETKSSLAKRVLLTNSSKSVSPKQTKGGNYYEKYLKYKNKYLSLKNALQ
jgi:nicotinamidase-related amidase